MRIFFDTEFIEDGNTIDLISIGMTTEFGGEYYAENAECDLTKADDWVKANVIPHLTGFKKSKQEIKHDILSFVGLRPTFYAYYSSYDWVALCRLFGRMIDLPSDWPMFCIDLKQYLNMIGNPTLPKQKGVEHNALEDAKWNAAVFKHVIAEDFKSYYDLRL